jgi:hypothetical protein
MAITTRYATNMAMQYNEVTLSNFLINPSVGSRRFLTEAEQTRILRATETSALYFLTDVTGAGRSARYRWYDSGGTLLNEYLLDLTSAGVHNSIPIDWTSFYVPSGATRLTVAIIGSANGFANGQFTLGSGNLFTSWTLTTVNPVDIIQDATGGILSSRCIQVFADSGETIYFRQSVPLVSGLSYTIRLFSKYVEEASNGTVEYKVGAGSWTAFDTALTASFQFISASFTSASTSTQAILFRYINESENGYCLIDDISISLTTPSELSEVRTYNLDDSCVAYEYELNWLNKLGGRDTWVFTGFPTTARDVQREGQLEYSRRTNLTAPNRIYGYRSVASRESITLSHQCKDRLTAEWIKSELIDTLDVLVKVGTSYYPADIVASSIVVSNTFSQDFTIRFTLRYAFDINVQTR